MERTTRFELATLTLAKGPDYRTRPLNRAPVAPSATPCSVCGRLHAMLWGQNGGKLPPAYGPHPLGNSSIGKQAAGSASSPRAWPNLPRPPRPPPLRPH
jgi:hypothetical protein